MRISIWNKRPLLASIECTQIEWSPSIHLLKNHILHVVGGELNPNGVGKEEQSEEDGPPDASRTNVVNAEL